MAETTTIRPAGRHIFTIGRDLIQSPHAALLEIVKNSFDADATGVDIEFHFDKKTKKFTLKIADDGHGMSKADISDKWMVPSSDNKTKKRLSPKGRTMQGRKGIGRYSASILGDDLLLSTVDSKKKKTTVYLQWKDFLDAKYLSDVEILVESVASDEFPGTTLTVSGGEETANEWQEKQFRDLIQELKKLRTPSSNYNLSKTREDSFEINLSVTGFNEEDFSTTIEPFPIIELFDYQIFGKIDKFGKGNLHYVCQKEKVPIRDSFAIDFSNLIDKPCGELTYDIRVFDRDPEGIAGLIARGLTDSAGNYVGKNQARIILNTNNGMGVYRSGFRIRPLGDPNFDWLQLNKLRLNDPSRKISDNQVIGFVHIQSDEDSGLVETSARDGLRENGQFRTLKAISLKVISNLEERRYIYRRNKKPRKKIEKELKLLFSDQKIKSEIEEKLEETGVGETVVSNIAKILEDDFIERQKAYERVSKAVAIYQDQATLGKIMNVVVHEGRRPLNFFKNRIPELEYWYEKYIANPSDDNLAKVIPIAQGLGLNAETFSSLFGRLDPLASGKRNDPKSFKLKDLIDKTFDIFAYQILEMGVSVKIEGSEKFEILGWRQDFYAIFTNLIDNSLFWMENAQSKEREISVKFNSDKNKFQFLDYRDSGPGIEKHLIESQVIFEPDFSMKPGEKSGLGMAIAGEAAARNDLEFKAFESATGAYFRLEPMVVPAR